MRRLLDWQARLLDYITRHFRSKLVYGEMDCALFAAGAVEAMTGVDLASEYRGAYGSFRDGRKLLKQRGFDDHIDLVGTLLEPVAPAFAHPGDVVSRETPEGPALGILQGPRAYFLTQDQGLQTVSRLEAVKAWRV